MPLGWYLAQGLIPLGPSSSDDEEGPCELPDGRIVCGPHGLATCGRCCLDFSFMDDVLSVDENDEEDDADELYWQLGPDLRAEIDARWGPPPPRRTDAQPAAGRSQEPEGVDNVRRNASGKEIRIGSGRLFPTKFSPPSDSVLPWDLFPGTVLSGVNTLGVPIRFVHRDDSSKFLIFTDGACLNNGQPNPKAGWAFHFGPGRQGTPAIASGRLECEGPCGEESIQSSNRAELRAVIAVFRFRNWRGEKVKTMVIATDSEYVVEGCTRWAKTWTTNGWQSTGGSGVKNKDLWEMLLGEVEGLADRGISVQFWRIPRGWNTVADAAAKLAATRDEAPPQWHDFPGIGV